MRRALKPSGPSAPRTSASAFALARDPRILYVYPGYTVFKPAPRPKLEVPLTVVVVADNRDLLLDTLRSLTTLNYKNYKIVISCISPKHNEAISSLVRQHKRYLPDTKLILMPSAGWDADALNNAMHAITTEYWCWVCAGDILHEQALAVVADAILTKQVDCYSTCRYVMQSNYIVRPPALPQTISQQALWSGTDFPYSKLITYRLGAIVKLKGFVSYDRYPGDTEWITAYRMLTSGMAIEHIPAAVYFDRMGKPIDKTTKPVEYRRALLMQRWPSKYIEESDEEATKQLLTQVVEETGRGSQASD